MITFPWCRPDLLSLCTTTFGSPFEFSLYHLIFSVTLYSVPGSKNCTGMVEDRDLFTDLVIFSQRNKCLTPSD